MHQPSINLDFYVEEPRLSSLQSSVANPACRTLENQAPASHMLKSSLLDALLSSDLVTKMQF